MPKEPGKAYAIIHDGTDILVGCGGQSGNPARLRQGYHLPGGSRNARRGSGVAKTFTLEGAREAVVRELREETGFVIAATTVWREIDADTLRKTANGAAGSRGIVKEAIFLVARVPSVAAMVAGFNRPVVVHRNDEPFMTVQAIGITAALTDNTNFCAPYGTSWFGFGIKAADAKGLL